MSETVSDIIAARMQDPGGFRAILGWSLAGHLVVGGGVLMALTAWLNRPVAPPPVVMTISLGGSPGPRTGGLTSIGGRTVEAPPPTPTEPVRRAETPPAPKTPAMTLPTTRPTRPPRPRVTQGPAESTGRTPATAQEPSQGPARADTQVRGQGFGLTTGGGAGSGVQLDVGNFCCPEYIADMVRTIQQNWSSKQDVAGSVVMHFTITRNGMILPESIQLEQSSGFQLHELASRRALLQTMLAPLPSAYPNPTLGVRMTFTYQR
jgi:hypothetical protein